MLTILLPIWDYLLRFGCFSCQFGTLTCYFGSIEVLDEKTFIFYYEF